MCVFFGVPTDTKNIRTFHPKRHRSPKQSRNVGRNAEKSTVSGIFTCGGECARRTIATPKRFCESCENMGLLEGCAVSVGMGADSRYTVLPACSNRNFAADKLN